MILPLLLAFAIVGCGGDDPERSFNEDDDARYTEQQVIDRAGFTSDVTVEELKHQGIEYDIRTWSLRGCEIGDVLTTRALVESYAGMGEAVVTNPAGDVGVTFSPAPGCRQKLLKALEAVE